MSIRTIVTAAASAVLANTWAVELPPSPTFPAAVFDIDTEPEERWSAGGGYDQHTVHFIVFSRDADQLDTLMPLMERAFEAIQPTFMFTESSGDADYEPDPSVYGRFLIVRMRTPRY